MQPPSTTRDAPLEGESGTSWSAPRAIAAPASNAATTTRPWRNPTWSLLGIFVLRRLLSIGVTVGIGFEGVRRKVIKDKTGAVSSCYHKFSRAPPWIRSREVELARTDEQDGVGLLHDEHGVADGHSAARYRGRLRSYLPAASSSSWFSRGPESSSAGEGIGRGRGHEQVQVRHVGLHHRRIEAGLPGQHGGGNP